MKPIVIKYEKANREKWNNFVYNNKSGYAYHLYDVIALDRWKNDKNNSFCIVNNETDEIVMIMQLHLEKRCNENEDDYRLHSRWGFVIKDGITRRERKKIRLCFQNYIDGFYKKYNIKLFDAALPPLCENNWPGEESINSLVYFGFVPGIRYTWIVNLNKPEDDLLKKCEETTRQAIRKFKRLEQYQIYEARGTEEEFLIYQKLHEETFRRNGGGKTIIYSEYNRNIMFNLIAQGICRVFFIKNTEDNIIYGYVTILIYKNTAYYWWGASLKEKEVGLNKFLLWESMMKVRQDYFNNLNSSLMSNLKAKSFYFETGGAYPYLRLKYPEGSNEDLHRGWNDFKKCFGCQLHAIFTGIYCAPVILDK